MKVIKSTKVFYLNLNTIAILETVAACSERTMSGVIQDILNDYELDEKMKTYHKGTSLPKYNLLSNDKE